MAAAMEAAVSRASMKASAAAIPATTREPSRGTAGVATTGSVAARRAVPRAVTYIARTAIVARTTVVTWVAIVAWVTVITWMTVVAAIAPIASIAIIGAVPRTCADEDSANEPARTIIAIRRASIRIIAIVAIGANGRRSVGVGGPVGIRCAVTDADCHADLRL